MKIAVRYQSRGGNTKAVAEAIAKAAGVSAETFDKPLEEPVDLLFIGGGVYAWGLDKPFKAYLEAISKESVKKIAPFTTAGGMDKTKDIAAIAGQRGIGVTAERLAVKFLLKNHASLCGGKTPVTLSEKQAAAAREFVANILKEASK